MFVRLLPKIDPRKLYGLFILFRLDDDGHMRRSRALFAGLAHDGLRRSFPMPPPLPE
jgi:hypothetical protein